MNQSGKTRKRHHYNLMLIAVGVVMLVSALLTSCGGSQGTDGQWLAHNQGEIYFLDISNNQGTVDYAVIFPGQGLRREHGSITVNNDGTVTVTGMVDGVLKDCSACVYHQSGSSLSIDYTYEPYGGGSNISGTLNFSPSDSGTYQNEVNQLHP